MKLVFCGVLVVAGVGFGALAWYPLITGKNYSGLLGRSLRASEDPRLKRAPAMYFRAMGAMVEAIAVFLIFFGVALVIAPDRPGPTWTAMFLIVLATFVVVEVVSGLILFIVAAKHGLFRWSRP